MARIVTRTKSVPATVRRGEGEWSVLAELDPEQAPFDYVLGDRIERVAWPTVQDALEDLPARIVRKALENGEAVSTRVEVSYADIGEDEE
jgi:hypothetical protein